MDTHIPYSDASKFASDGIWYPNAANFPCAKLLWHSDDYSSGKDWVDRISGVILRNDDGFVKDTDGVAQVTAALSVVLPSGVTMPVPGTKQFALAWSGKIGAAAHVVTIGDSISGKGLSLAGSGVEFITYDASNYAASAVLPGPPTYPFSGCMILHADTDADNEARKYAANSSGSIYATVNKNGAGSAGTLQQTWPALTTAAAIPTSASISRIKMLALFVFNTPPPDMPTATKWMAANIGKVYPRWAGAAG